MYDYKNNKPPKDYYDTGFSFNTVYDMNCDFYLIHPNENDFIRNISGKVVNVNNNNKYHLNF